MELRCGCGHVVRDVDVGRGPPLCPSCDAVLLRVRESATRPRETPRAFRAGTRAIGQDASVTEVGYRGSAGPVSRRWVYRWVRWPAALFIAAFGACALFAGSAIVLTDSQRAVHGVAGSHRPSHGVRDSDRAFSAVMSVCASLFGAWLLYLAITVMLNRTTIELGPVHLTARSGPLPTIGPQRVDTSLGSGDIARFEVRPSAMPRDPVTFEVLAVHLDGRPSVLLRAMTAEHALYIAAELDDALRRDDPVA